MRSNIVSRVAAGLLAVLAVPAVADVRLARIFASHMVLQRDMPLPVWGWAEPGERVTVRLLAWSDLPFVGQVRSKTAPYTVDGDTISSDAIRGGTSVQYHFDQGHLVIRYEEGKTVRFDRKACG